jgi:predicted ester cyclase
VVWTGGIPDTTPDDDLEAWFRTWLERCNAHDLVGLGRLIADEVLVDGWPTTRAGHLATLAETVASFADQSGELLRLTTAAPWITAVLFTRGTHTGPWRGLAPTGRVVFGQELGLYRVEHGLLAEVWTASDDLGRAEDVLRPRAPRR